MAEELVEIDCILTTHRYLNFITVPFFLLNSFGLFVIYFATPKHLGTFKYYQLIVQFLGLLNDFFLCSCVLPVPCFPAPSVLYIGLFANLGVSKICQISLQTFLLIEFVVALLGAIFEKGQAVLPDHHWAKFGRRKALVTEIFWYSHPLFLLEPIVYAIWAANDEKVAFNEQIQRFPEITSFLTNVNVWILEKSVGSVFVATLAIYFSLFGAVLFGLLIFTNHTLTQQRNFMSSRTLHLHKKWIRNLNLQLIVLFVMFLVPDIWFIICFLTANTKIICYSIFASFFFASHSTVGTIVQLTCYDTYREFVFRLIRCENPIKKKKKLQPIARIAVAWTKEIPKTNINERSRISRSTSVF
ncbi:unnamed protein product, partial [Mesorhabditis belari]|uniref:Uncharacterized protein n=1 Tax=Mesorhabditis belari TaxID=2138241 RepID=A0AAF3F0N5_9BILA